jgi:hypothetical protein
LEKGEVGILTGQFAALAVAILLLSSLGGASAISVPKVVTVYWGAPSGNVALTTGANNDETVNASTISVFYTLAPSTTPYSVSAIRLCLNAGENNTGGVYTYTDVKFLYDNASRSNYISFGPVEQQLGQSCTYTVQLTDSLQQTATASWIVQVQPPKAT